MTRADPGSLVHFAFKAWFAVTVITVDVLLGLHTNAALSTTASQSDRVAD